MHFSLITLGSVMFTAMLASAVPIFPGNINVVQNLFGNSTVVKLVPDGMLVLGKTFDDNDNDGAFGLACKNDEDRLLAGGQSAGVAAAARAFCLCMNGPDDFGVNSVKTCTRQHDEALIAAGAA